MMEIGGYTWIFALGMIFAFLDAYGIGANDVANSFATSVGSRSLTLKQAVGIALFTEFGGAILLGASTTETIKNKIISLNLFKANPEVLMLLFLCALVGSSFWVITASKFGWPVSTTHSIVGAIVGAGVAAFGFNAVVWGWQGMSQIFASWFISPVLAGVLGAVIFYGTRTTVLTHSNSLRRGLIAIPFYFFFTFLILTFYLINKAPKGIDLSKQNKVTGAYVNANQVGLVLGIAFGVAAFVTLIVQFTFVPFMHRFLVDEEDLKLYQMFYIYAIPKQPKNCNLEKHLLRGEVLDTESQTGTGRGSNDEINTLPEKDLQKTVETIDEKETLLSKAQNLVTGSFAYLTRGFHVDIAGVQDGHIQTVHDCAQKYDSKTEYLYSLLQVCTAMFASFAHGSNDIANAIGPIAGIYQVWQSAQIPNGTTDVPIWIIAYGALALDLGLAFFGYRVMQSLGNNITYHSPSRGFSMELGAAITVVTASFLGIPVSTTHCITGATVGVGLIGGGWKAVNWKMVSWTLFSWIATVPVVALISGCLMLLLLAAPHIN